MLKTDAELKPLNFVLKNSDILILCAPHSIYKKISTKGKKIIDVWGYFKK